MAEKKGEAKAIGVAEVPTEPEVEARIMVLALGTAPTADVIEFVEMRLTEPELVAVIVELASDNPAFEPDA